MLQPVRKATVDILVIRFHFLRVTHQKPDRALVLIERMHNKRGMPVRFYPPRGEVERHGYRNMGTDMLEVDVNDPAPPPVWSFSEDEDMPERQRKRRRAEGERPEMVQ